jgi:transaldolase
MDKSKIDYRSNSMEELMRDASWLRWLSDSTDTRWWCDSADPQEIKEAACHGAVGVTTNPILCAIAICGRTAAWKDSLKGICSTAISPSAKAEKLLQFAVTEAAKAMEVVIERSSDGSGYVCAQLDPSLAGKREIMIDAGRRFSGWGKNISVKVPATRAGIEAIESLAAEGIPVTGTVSFTLPQLLAIAEAHARGSARAREKGIQPAPCNAVIMIGRIDDYLQDVAADSGLSIPPDDLRRAGLAIVKRGYGIFRARRYAAKICIAALRGVYHVTNLAGADIVASIHPKYQFPLLDPSVPKESLYDVPVDRGSVERLMDMPEFRRAYEPDGLSPEEFITYGATQRTLSQFIEGGWKILESFAP